MGSRLYRQSKRNCQLSTEQATQWKTNALQRRTVIFPSNQNLVMQQHQLMIG